MKLNFNGKTFPLPGGKTYEERNKIINDILAEYEEYFLASWESPRTKKILEMMGTYLSRAKEFRKDMTHPTLGANREGKLYGGDTKFIPFTYLHKEIKDMLGLDNKDDIYE